MSSVDSLPLNNKQKVLIDDPIYTKYDLSDVSDEDLAKFILMSSAVDAYCEKCEKLSVFGIEGENYGFQEKAKSLTKFGVITIEARCRRDGDGIYDKCQSKLLFCFYRDYNNFIKIGQYPSKAVLDFGQLDPIFSKELDRNLRKELGKAIGLQSHGVGIGSFVYLRRIFEKLIENAHIEAELLENWDNNQKNDYMRKRMSEKIQTLAHYLPNRMVKNSNLYNILSKGIHELEEEECLSHFDLVLRGILMILKERHEEREHEQLIKDLENAISS